MRLPATFALAVVLAAPAQSPAEGHVVIRTWTSVEAGQFPGSMSRVWGGGNGRLYVIATKDRRLLVKAAPFTGGSPDEGNPTIVDFDRQQVVVVRPSLKEYSVDSFGDVRRENARLHGLAASTLDLERTELPRTGVALPGQSRRRASRFEYRTTTSETGRQRSIASYDTREVVLTLEAVEKGKTLEAAGGWVVTSTVWLGTRLPSVDRVVALQREYLQLVTKGIYLPAFTDVELPMFQWVDPYVPELVFVAMELNGAVGKLDGTPLAGTTTYELQRTPKEYDRAVADHLAQTKRLSGSGVQVAGALPGKRAQLVRLAFEYVEIGGAMPAEDWTIPTTFTRKDR